MAFIKDSDAVSFGSGYTFLTVSQAAQDQIAILVVTAILTLLSRIAYDWAKTAATKRKERKAKQADRPHSINQKSTDHEKEIRKQELRN